MGPLQAKLTSDMKTAMKAKEKERLSLIRLLINDLKETQYRSGDDELDEEAEQAVLRKSAKMRRDSIAEAEKANRPEIAEKEAAELALIEAYLPQMMDQQETRAKVQELLGELGITQRKEQGRFMKEWMSKYKAVSDGRVVNGLLGELLE